MMIYVFPLHERLAYRPASKIAIVTCHDCCAVVGTIVFPFQRFGLDMEVLSADLETDLWGRGAVVVAVEKLAAYGLGCTDVVVRSQVWRLVSNV